jgi:hypothetical protein
MPAATPLPRGPSVLTLYGAADLLTAPGCPVCRYASESSERYLGWFALEGHAQPGTITTLCGSLGMCARHTRRLMSQPGAAIRLTPVYRYVITAARDRLAGSRAPVAACAACTHDDAAAGRALETLLEGLADGDTMWRCRDLGGVCIPHLAAAGRRRQPGAVGWLLETMQETLAARPARPEWLAALDQDAEVRAVLRRSLPASGTPAPGACVACGAAAQAERDSLARLPDLARVGPDEADPALTLCGTHLADAAVAADVSGLRALLDWQAACLAAGSRLRTGRRAALSARRLLTGQRTSRPGGCPVCRAQTDAAQHQLDRMRRAVRASPDGRNGRDALCVRHQLLLRHSDQQAGLRLAETSVAAAELLIDELTEAFEMTIQARSRGLRMPESTTWRRAAAFLDGSVFGGPLQA